MNEYENKRLWMFEGDESYEEIMRKFMDMASDVNNVPWFIGDLINGGCQIFDVIIKILNKIKSTTKDTLDVSIFPIKPVLLALIWGLLLMEIVRKYTGSCADFEKERIAKLVISLVLSLFAGFTGYMHSGGYAGVSSPTKYIRTLYNAEKYIESEYPRHYNKIPTYLRIPSHSDFDSLIRSQQISAAKGMNMAYTFRVGDTLLDNLSGSTVCSEDVLERTFKSLWPLPTEYESKKMYKLYTDNKIYYL